MSHSNIRDLREFLRVAYQTKIDLRQVQWDLMLPFCLHIHTEIELQHILEMAFMDFTNQVQEEILKVIEDCLKTNEDLIHARINIIEKLTSSLQLIESISKQTQWVAQQFSYYVLNKTFDVNSANLEGKRLIFMKNLLENKIIHEFINSQPKQIHFNLSMEEIDPDYIPTIQEECSSFSKILDLDNTGDRAEQEKWIHQTNELIARALHEQNLQNKKYISIIGCNIQDCEIQDRELQMTERIKFQDLIADEIKIPRSGIYEMINQEVIISKEQSNSVDKNQQNQFKQKSKKQLPQSKLECNKKNSIIIPQNNQLQFLDDQQIYQETLRNIYNNLNDQKYTQLPLTLPNHELCHQTSQTQQSQKNSNKKRNKKRRQNDLLGNQLPQPDFDNGLIISQSSDQGSVHTRKCQDDIKDFEDRLEADFALSREEEILRPKISAQWITKFQQMLNKKINCLRNK